MANAEDMQGLVKVMGFDSKTLRNGEARRNAVKEIIQDASETIRPGDILVVSYSGHGG